MKNLLRSPVSDENLEPFMLMSLERNILNIVDVDEVIDSFEDHIELLRRELSSDYVHEFCH